LGGTGKRFSAKSNNLPALSLYLEITQRGATARLVFFYFLTDI
jgi:hypothetical protein